MSSSGLEGRLNALSRQLKQRNCTICRAEDQEPRLKADIREFLEIQAAGRTSIPATTFYKKILQLEYAALTASEATFRRHLEHIALEDSDDAASLAG